MREELYKQIDDAVNDELKAATEKFSANNSRHESYAVLLEEFEELQNEMEQLNTRFQSYGAIRKAMPRQIY